MAIQPLLKLQLNIKNALVGAKLNLQDRLHELDQDERALVRAIISNKQVDKLQLSERTLSIIQKLEGKKIAGNQPEPSFLSVVIHEDIPAEELFCEVAEVYQQLKEEARGNFLEPIKQIKNAIVLAGLDLEKRLPELDQEERELVRAIISNKGIDKARLQVKAQSIVEKLKGNQLEGKNHEPGFLSSLVFKGISSKDLFFEISEVYGQLKLQNQAVRAAAVKPENPKPFSIN